MANKSKDVKSRPAGINDNFDVVAADINNVVDKNSERMTLESTRSARIPVLSTQLQEGISIKAYDGGKEQREDIDR